MKKNKKIYFILKRIMDICFGIVGIIIIIPCSVIIKILFLLNKDFYPMFYIQNRVGKNGKIFKIFKFRTMVYRADKNLDEMLKNNKKFHYEFKKSQKIFYDPRVTKVGRILRKFSIDELPQFINVLLGNMSLIGPRPLVEGELKKHNGKKSIYESVKPGMTSWWVANGHSHKNYKKRLELEYYYINNISFILDVKCFFKTILLLFKRNGI